MPETQLRQASPEIQILLSPLRIELTRCREAQAKSPWFYNELYLNSRRDERYQSQVAVPRFRPEK